MIIEDDTEPSKSFSTLEEDNSLESQHQQLSDQEEEYKFSKITLSFKSCGLNFEYQKHSISQMVNMFRILQWFQLVYSVTCFLFMLLSDYSKNSGSTTATQLRAPLIGFIVNTVVQFVIVILFLTPLTRIVYITVALIITSVLCTIACSSTILLDRIVSKDLMFYVSYWVVSWNVHCFDFLKNFDYFFCVIRMQFQLVQHL